MPKVDLRKENEILKAVREEIIANPMISLRRLQISLKERGFVTYSGNVIEDQYLKKLVRKVSRQAVAQSDQQEIGQRLSQTRQRFEVMMEKLYKIAFWRIDFIKEGYYMPEYKDQIKAMDSIAKMDLALLQAEMDAGVFQRHLGKIDIEVARRQPIPDSVRVSAWTVFKNWGIVPPEAEMPKLENGGNQPIDNQPSKPVIVAQQNS